MNDKTLNAAQLAEIICWTETIRGTECKSFVDVALRHPEIWSLLRQEGFRRRIVAQALGWPLRIEVNVIQTFSAAELGAMLLNHGSDNAVDFWKTSPDLCNQLHRADKLHGALSFLRSCLDSDRSEHEMSDAHAESMVCGYVQAWLRLDQESARNALDQQQLDSVLEALPVLSSAGWMTLGGPVFDLPDLIIARLLESAGIEFDAPGSASAVDDGAPPRDAFRLQHHRLIIRVCTATDLRRDWATRTTAQGFVTVDSRLIDSEGSIIGFAHHVIESLRDAGLSVALSDMVTYASLLQPESVRCRS